MDNSHRVGEIRKNTYGSLMEVIQYNGCSDIWVKFIEYGNKVHTSWQAFQKGNVKNVYDRTIYGVGYFGEGIYKSKLNKKYTQQYISWRDMLSRCYDKNLTNKTSSYKECLVCEEWLNFQNYAAWYDDNHYQVEGEKMNLDKDILVKGNKIYSPDNCVFVPQSINILFTKRTELRGKYPIGVTLHNKKFRSRYSNGKGKEVHIGHFNSVEEAFEAYRVCKERLIKDIAEEYKDRIPKT